MIQVKCRWCGAAIIWALTQAGKRMPVDAEPTADGNIYLLEHGGDVTVYFPYKGELAPTAKMYKSHFASCVNTLKHRKR